MAPAKFVLQSDAILTWPNITWYCFKTLQWLKQNINHSLSSPETTHSSLPQGYGVSKARIWEKTDNVLTAVYNVCRFMQSFNRHNLKYAVLPKKGKAITTDIINLIQNQFHSQSGIVYCLSRWEKYRMLSSLPASLCVCMSVCMCVNHKLVHVITHDPFKLGSPNLDQRWKTLWLRSLLFWGAIDRDFQGQI